MATPAQPASRLETGRQLRIILALFGAAICALVTLGMASGMLPSHDVITLLTLIGFPALVAWFLFNRNYVQSLAALVLYLGLLDGFLRLKTGDDNLTIVRDGLFYCIVIGAALRLMASETPIKAPPLTWLVVAFVGVVLVQIFNPDNGTWLHSFAALRQHIAWVPMFFLGYAAFQTSGRVRGFLLVLAIIAAVNGIVSYVQFHLTPDQLASWGPGYYERINGGGGLSGRIFVDANGIARTRPFALGSDMGFGGILGLLSAAGALALVATARSRWARVLAIVTLPAIVLGVMTSQARVAVIGTALSVLIFGMLATISRRSFATLFAIAFATLVGMVVVQHVTTNNQRGAFERYDSLSTNPGDLVSTAYNYRSSTVGLIPEYGGKYPLGAGLGSAGPAASYPGAPANAARLASESQPSFLIIELGLPGLLIWYALSGLVVVRGLVRIPRIRDPEARLLVSAVLAPYMALIAAGWVGATTPASPGGPFYWFATGLLVYWTSAAAREGPRHERA